MYLHTYTYYASRVKSMFVEIFFLPARARIDVTKRWHNTSPPPRSLIHPLLSVVQRLPLEYRSDSCLWIIDARPYMYIILCTFKFSSLFGGFFFLHSFQANIPPPCNTANTAPVPSWPLGLGRWPWPRSPFLTDDVKPPRSMLIFSRGIRHTYVEQATFHGVNCTPISLY